MATLVEQLARRLARRTTQNGKTVLVTNNDPLLVDAFAELGWSDPYVDESTEEAATVRDAERAVVPKAKGHTR